jgi:dTDP-4-amino-4,6-dideoxygalactose transaminase
MNKIEFFKHNCTEEDILLANQVMRSTFLTTGPMVSKFERKFSKYLKITETVGLNSCTGAIHLALLRYGIEPGDEVITTPMTFVATANAILQAGAIPIFVDICPKSGLLLHDAVEASINSKTKAIIPVHLYGRMVDMHNFSKLSLKYNLVLIEDAAHCIEGIRDGVRPGQLSHAACFSFYTTKSMTCGEGGAIACRSSKDALWYRSARHHGISKSASYRYFKGFQHWDMETMGWKYNMSDIQAAILINQIDRLGINRQRRQDLEMFYRSLFEDINGLDFMEKPGENEINAHHLFTVLLPKNVSRDEVVKKLQENGIGCAVNYRAIHTLTYFREKFGYKPEDFPIAYEIGSRTITFPLYPKLTEDEIVIIHRTFKKILYQLSRSSPSPLFGI